MNLRLSELSTRNFNTPLKKFWKIFRSLLLGLIALIILLWLLIQTTPVQNLIIDYVAGKLSKGLNTRVQINHVNFDLFNTMRLEGLLVEDREQDTLMYAGNMRVNITDWFFIRKNVELKYVGLENAVIHLTRTDSVWNYHFLMDYFSRNNNSARRDRKIDLRFNRLELHNIELIRKDIWRGENINAHIGGLELQADHFDIPGKTVQITSLHIDNPRFSIFNYPAIRVKPTNTAEDEYIAEADKLRWNTENWNLSINEFRIRNGELQSDRLTDRKPYGHFDGLHIYFKDIQADFENIYLDRDSIKAAIVLSTEERSGFKVNNLQSNVVIHPEAMEFHQLEISTPSSTIGNYFALTYQSFSDIKNFNSRVRIEADFDKSDLHSDDIAYFAPALSTWKTSISLSGQVRGSVENLNGRNIAIEVGRNTILNGDFSILGLPYTENTYLDFNAKDFRTNYRDIIDFFPGLRKIQQPRLDQVEYLHFKGNFTGFFRDFVTYGTINTNLGSFTTDLNMKTPQYGNASYSGKIRTSNFNLGKFLNSSNIGKLEFEGSVSGEGLTAKSLNLELDGEVNLLEYKNYPYQNIIVNGRLADRLFNGELISYDPNLDARLNGLIDFSEEVPVFDFEASMANVNLHTLHILDDSLEFNGKFGVNFTGDNIDNFLGTARIYDAAIYRKDKRISFDSLFLESKISGNQKIITAVSNEFDAALAGEFNITTLPKNFQTFLSKYFPAYIKPLPVSEQENANFSFVVSTKMVDEYINLINKNLSGFNNSTFTGRINARENLLDFNAEVSQFSFKNIIGTDISLNASGDMQQLSLDGAVGNVYINDSLHFPGTNFTIKTSNDISDVSIITNSNQSLNMASLQGKVQTLKNGVKITFDESVLELKGKQWTIDKNGELTLSEDLILADGIRLHNDRQEIQLTTIPSDIGNSNDLRIDLKNIYLGDFMPFVLRQQRVEGLLTGNVLIIDPFKKLAVEIDAEAEQFRFENDSIGILKLSGYYDHRRKNISFNSQSDNDQYHFNLFGEYQLKDSTNAENLTINGRLEQTKINLLQPYLNTVFSDMTGFATGNLTITGPPNDLDYIGKMQLSNAALRVKYTNVLYKIPTAFFNFYDDHIDFGSFVIQDTLGNNGRISRGKLYHNGFKDLSFDFAMNTGKLLVLHTKNNGTDPFYGTVIAEANMQFTGPLNAMVMDITGQPTDSSSLYITTQVSRESGQADFVVWKVYGREMESLPSASESKLTVNLDLNANNYVNMYVILDELTGDVIRATGRGNFQIKAGTDGEFSIAGRYDIEEGNYNFSFESLLKKPFKLKEGAGNYILWTGDPYDANIRIDAEYEADNVRFSDLGLGNKQINTNVLKYRGKVLVLAKLTGELMRPTIDFEINLPQGSQLQNDADAQNLIREIQEDPNELNKQVAFLIVFNSFGPLSTSTEQGNFANTAFEGIVVNSISGVLSNTLSKQFSNIFQKLFNDKSIQVNFNAQFYSGTNFLNTINTNPFNLDRTNVNLSIGKSIFNESVTFTLGSAMDIGLSEAQISATRNLPFLPDITAEWKITPDGKLVLMFFYRDTYNYLMEGARQNRTGVSISLRKDFDRIIEIWRKEEK